MESKFRTEGRDESTMNWHCTVLRLESKNESAEVPELWELDLETRPQEGFDGALRPTETDCS